MGIWKSLFELQQVNLGYTGFKRESVHEMKRLQSEKVEGWQYAHNSSGDNILVFKVDGKLTIFQSISVGKPVFSLFSVGIGFFLPFLGGDEIFGIFFSGDRFFALIFRWVGGPSGSQIQGCKVQTSLYVGIWVSLLILIIFTHPQS